MEKLNEQQRTNDLLEKMLIVQLRGQGVGSQQIAKFIGKRSQTVSDILKMITPKGGDL